MTILRKSESATTTAAPAGVHDRRIHPRVKPGELSTPATICIPGRPPVSLIDLSPGGALIDLPFQIRPNTRLTVEFRAAAERIMLPLRLLRCYVTSLHGGVHYQAAGEFEQPLEWTPLRSTESQTIANRLIATLEAFLQQGPAVGRVAECDHLLVWVLEAARRQESRDRISMEIQRRLTQLIPSIVVEAATKPSPPNPANGARFFGFDFSSGRALTTLDRRLLRTAAQLLSIVNTNIEGAPSASQPLEFKPRQEPAVITHSIADWQQLRVREERQGHAAWFRYPEPDIRSSENPWASTPAVRRG